MLQAWVVEVLVAGRLPAAAAARLRERLSRSANVTIEDECWSAQLQVDAADPIEAGRRALDLLEPDGPIARLTVMTAAEAERELVAPRLPDLVGVLDVQELAGLRTKQRALQVTELPGFPTPAVVTRAGRLWVRAAVERFLSQWPRRPGRPPRPRQELDATRGQPD